VIETERLVLRQPRPGDDLSEFVADDDMQQWIGGPQPADQLLDLWLRRWERNGIGQFIVELDGALIGRVGFIVWDGRTWETSAFDLAGEHAEVELGWAILSRHWGHGYATEASRAARDWLAPRRTISLIRPDNVRSQRVAEKLGATPGETIEMSGYGPHVVWEHPES
jgi:RimJ/RimL family protein N-acetyltransferase